jgi:hypothetical protein
MIYFKSRDEIRNKCAYHVIQPIWDQNGEWNAKIHKKEHGLRTIGQIRHCVDDFCNVAGENVVLDEYISPTLPDNMPLSPS